MILQLRSCSQAPLAGWASPSVIAPVIIGVVTLLAFALWEIKGAKSPILPFDIWRAPTFLAVMSSAFLSFMSFGIFIFCTCKRTLVLHTRRLICLNRPHPIHPRLSQDKRSARLGMARAVHDPRFRCGLLCSLPHQPSPRPSYNLCKLSTI